MNAAAGRSATMPGGWRREYFEAERTCTPRGASDNGVTGTEEG